MDHRHTYYDNSPLPTKDAPGEGITNVRCQTSVSDVFFFLFPHITLMIYSKYFINQSCPTTEMPELQSTNHLGISSSRTMQTTTPKRSTRSTKNLLLRCGCETHTATIYPGISATGSVQKIPYVMKIPTTQNKVGRLSGTLLNASLSFLKLHGRCKTSLLCSLGSPTTHSLYELMNSSSFTESLQVIRRLHSALPSN